MILTATTTKETTMPIEDDGFITVHPAHISTAARKVTLRASIERIARKAEIMALDATRGTPARQDAEEIRILADIALRQLGEAAS